MSDCISRELLLSGLNDIRQTYKEAKNFDAVSAIDNAIGEVKDTPVSDVQEVKHGKWLYQEPDDAYSWKPYLCSVCGEKGGKNYTEYCPHCGAKMDGEDMNK